VTSLPFDYCRAIPINKLIGECLIMAVNGTADHSTVFPLSKLAVRSHGTTFLIFFLHFRTPGRDKMTLDCAQVTYIRDDEIELSLKDGELYVLTLCAISVRGVLSFHQLAFGKSTYSWASA
jgi:cleavage and polyadenylation specificity factor subunit 1